MRRLSIIFIICAFLASAYALATQQPEEHGLNTGSRFTKGRDHVGQNPGTPDGREGGEKMDDAPLIPSLPFTDTGNTADNYDDYDAVCPYSGSTSPDVVYTYFATEDQVITVDLCGSSYDTKTYIYEGSMDLVYCNDDFYFSGDPCGTYVSKIEEAFLYAGQFYHIVIDGYGGDGGDYILNIDTTDPPEPCVIDVNDDENEPAGMPGYVDLWNSGCNDETGLTPFQYLESNEYGMLNFGGQSGWPEGPDAGMRETDWFIVTLGETGIATWTVDAEQETYIFILGPQDCASVGVLESLIVGPCLPASLTLQGNPGELVWLWVGPADYYPPTGFVGYEYYYVMDFEGLDPAVISTQESTLDRVKSLYR